jgi:hypothetical protein
VPDDAWQRAWRARGRMMPALSTVRELPAVINPARGIDFAPDLSIIGLILNH